MSSQTLGVFCLNVRMFCICVVTNVTCVLLKCLLILHLCRHNRIVGSVSTLVCFTFVLSQTYLVFCLNICMFCICVVFLSSQTYGLSIFALFKCIIIEFYAVYAKSLHCLSADLLKNSLERTVTCLFSIHLQSISVTMKIDNNTFAHYWVFKTKLKFFKFFRALTLSF